MYPFTIINKFKVCRFFFLFKLRNMVNIVDTVN